VAGVGVRFFTVNEGLEDGMTNHPQSEAVPRCYAAHAEYDAIIDQDLEDDDDDDDDDDLDFSRETQV